MNQKQRMVLIGAVSALLAATLVAGESASRSDSRHRRVAAPFEPAPNAQTRDQAMPAEPKILYYQDPMHPWYHSDKPGFAPDCGIKLVPVYASEVAGPALPPGSVAVSPARQQLMGVVTARAEYGALDETIRAVGQVAIDETRRVNVHVKTSGWIEKVFVNYTWQPVQQGEPLFTYYSPDLVATEQEYLLALRARDSLAGSSFPEVAAGGATLLEAARRRLELWDLTDAQIHQLETEGKPQHNIIIYAPAEGYVLERKAYPNQYVTPETEIYKLVDLSTVWAEGDIYESDAPAVSVGQEAVLTSEALPNLALRGRLTFINPDVKPDTRTLTVRMEFPNPDLKLKPGMFVNLELHRGLGRSLTVPIDAVLDSGQHQRVFIDRGNGVFEPREVKVGARTADYAVILGGIRAGERVVTRANFLIDSESNLRESLAGMEPGEATSGAHSGHATPAEKMTMPMAGHQH